MNKTDLIYQKAVDVEAEKLLELSANEFLNIEDYGSVETLINGKKDSIGFWHWKLDDTLHHIVYQANRRVFLFFYKKYLSGAKLDSGCITKLSDEELGNYD